MTEVQYSILDLIKYKPKRFLLKMSHFMDKFMKHQSQRNHNSALIHTVPVQN